ncbi:hypothetical protein Tcan_09861 [Toxocara canis]|uniref:PHD-type domain-containing protein n=1 Tax=Toxocara canis TaxID=6265 RepID=A0A0B2VIB6_TOXCA|nr:hypothetical protein Tcan_09861 [Toxocara canis]
MAGVDKPKETKRRSSSVRSTLRKSSSKRRKTIARRHFDVDSEDERASERNECVSTRWKCALCQQRSSRSILGDLFGPYFVHIPGKHWPSFLAKKPPHLNPEQKFVFDLWLHGMCALTAPDIQMWDNQLPALETKIVSFWKQHCVLCSKEGATIEVKGKLMHFPCAVMKGYKLDIPMEQISPNQEDN